MVLSLANEKQNLISCLRVYLIHRRIFCCEKNYHWKLGDLWLVYRLARTDMSRAFIKEVSTLVFEATKIDHSFN